jgi:sodium/bile acid cotransporter 7
MNVHGDTGGLRQVGSIVLQLLVPFVAGHLLRPLIGGWIERHRPLIGKTDQTSILLVVYAAFSEAVTHGIWHQVGIGSLAFIVGGSIVLLAIVLVVNTYMARWLGFSKADEITIVFCGSKKSLANGIPMANILFPAATVGIMVLPLMVFHQVQLMTCAVLAKRYQRKQRAQQAVPNANAQASRG